MGIMKELFVLLAGMLCEILRVLAREIREMGEIFEKKNDVWNNWDFGKKDGLVNMNLKIERYNS